MRIVFLDSGPLSLLANPKQTPTTLPIRQWAYDLTKGGVSICIPQIVDYEVRRELLRARKTAGLARLDQLKDQMTFVLLPEEVMNHAANLWASARNRGRTTAPAEALDADCILAAQAILSARPEDTVTVATTNLGHLGLFVDARPREEIGP